MADDFLYVSRNKLEMNRGLRHSYMGDVPAPVVYAVQGELKEYYGVPGGRASHSFHSRPYSVGSRRLNVRHSAARAGCARNRDRSR